MRLLSPSRLARQPSGAQRFLLDVESVLHERGAIPENTEARPGLAGDDARPQMRVDSGIVSEGDEGVIGDPGFRAPGVKLCIDAPRRPEQLQRLIDHVTAEVVENPAGILGLGAFAPALRDLRSPALEA